MIDQLMKSFKNPASEYRGAPFWAWNAKLEPAELRRQIRVMKEMGLGGFFMHARVGLATPYLEKEWFECIDACVDEAKKLGMQAWLYDEDRWPSGAAGSLVTKDEEFRIRFLGCAEAGEPERGVDLVWFLVTWNGGKVAKYERVADPKAVVPTADQKLYRFYVRISETSSWFNGGTYLDTLNKKAVERFVEVTHEAYKKHNSADFGKTIPGIFTDEPNYEHGMDGFELPWTGVIPEAFQKKYGYDLLNHLPELFFDCGKTVSNVLWNYYDLLTDLFSNSFCGTIGKWCGKNGFAMTGHMLCEDRLGSQTRCVGAAMRNYEEMQVPGIDLLTEHWFIFNTAKQCTSAARQFGRKFRLSETYGCTGWDFPFMGHKALGDWQFALGINIRCQHLAWYSMEAEAKRDYPASISYQSSWYKKYSTVEDYFARIGSVIVEGREIRDILVVHPIESYWSMYFRQNHSAELEKLENDFADLTNQLLSENLDFDFGDEELMSRYAKSSDGVFTVGKADYKEVLIPELKTIRSSTLNLLTDFVRRGGTVLYLGNAPAFVDALPSDAAKKAYEKFQSVTKLNLAEELTRNGRRLSVAYPSGAQIYPVLSRLSENNGTYSLFLCNTGTEFNPSFMSIKLVRERLLSFPEAGVELAVPESGSVYELDPSTGTAYAVESVYRDGKYCFRTSFAELQSRLFLITKETPADVKQVVEYQNIVKKQTLDSKNWDIRLDDRNVLVLDHAALEVEGRKDSESAYILTLDDHIRQDLLGVAPRSGIMVQPWLRTKTVPKKQLALKLIYSFECGELPASDCLLALERPELYEYISLNGRELDRKPTGWWTDLVIQTLTVPANLFRKGGNTIEISGNYHENLPGLEAMFLLGDFGVANETIIARPRKLDIGDWGPQGLEEYSGDVTYLRKMEIPCGNGQRVFLKFGAWSGTAIGVSVNGSEEKMLPWAPFEVDVTDFLKSGENELAVTVYGNRRNAFGPFFIKEKWPSWTGPGEFKRLEVSERQLVPCGLLSAPELVFKK